jgi:hypothetical protein
MVVNQGTVGHAAAWPMVGTVPLFETAIGVFTALVSIFSLANAAAEDVSPKAAEHRAVAFLALQVPKWAKENKCYSCHNNGDAARALMAAHKSGVLADRASLGDTLAFLAAPERWDANGPEGQFKDKRLARIQFAGALVDAVGAGLIADRSAPELVSKPSGTVPILRRAPSEGWSRSRAPWATRQRGQWSGLSPSRRVLKPALAKAAGLVAELQTADGSWESDAAGSVGSPVTYGRTLTTAMALRTLTATDRTKYRAQIDKAQLWLETAEAKSVLDAAATLWALADSETVSAAAQRNRCFALIREGESPDGGWGPFVNSPREVFDTALVLLALAAQKDQPSLAAMIARGRKFLLAVQSSDGSWPATTRPPGVDSYAQQLSTTGWATQALLATRQRLPRNKRERESNSICNQRLASPLFLLYFSPRPVYFSFLPGAQ